MEVEKMEVIVGKGGSPRVCACVRVLVRACTRVRRKLLQLTGGSSDNVEQYMNIDDLSDIGIGL